MNNEKIVSILLCTVILFSTLAIASDAKTKCNCEQTPIVYIRGRCSLLANKYLPKDEKTNPGLPHLDDGQAESILKELVPIYAKGYITNDFEPFKKEFTKAFAEIYKDYTLDKNGEVTNDSGIYYLDEWRNTNITDVHKENGEITSAFDASDRIYKYFYQYDCRLSPCEIADDLKLYLQKVKEVTGHDKIKVIARCLGTSIISAYLAKYGWNDIEDLVLYNAVVNGTAVTNSLFNGELYFDANAVDYFASQNLDDTAVFSLIKEIITLADKTYGLDLTMDYFNKTATKVARYVVPDVMRVSYATTPGYWAMVSADRYKEARDYIFAGVKDEWSGLIKKLDKYYKTVSSKLNTMYKQMEKDGVHVYNISKYGFQLYPIMEDVGYQSDKIVTVQQQAPGTVAAPIGKTFDNAYIKNAIRNKTDKYISPDKSIDASASLFPDTTWYIKDIEHNCFPAVIDELIYSIFRYELTHNGEKMTVFNNEKYPQYLIYEGPEDNGDSIRPQTRTDPGESIHDPSFLEIFRNLFQKLIGVLKNLIANIVGKL